MNHNSSLAIKIDAKGINAVITNFSDGEKVKSVRLNYSEDMDNLKALEEIIYDNPELIGEYRRVDIAIDNNMFFVMDIKDAETPGEIERRIESLWPESRHADETEILTTPVEDDKTIFVYAVSRKLTAFLRRTFNNPLISHRLGVLAKYHAHKNRLGNMGKVHVNLSADKTDIIVFGHQGLLMANTLSTKTPEDAAYYTLAVMRHFEYDNQADRVLVAGNISLREKYVGLMRNFVNFVVPEIFPSELSAANTYESAIPFELLLIPMIFPNSAIKKEKQETD